ncbi:MAG: class I SAM-dependent methyltransferase [Lachnospiraceae bacterium]|nr:class I SAM-dependent methyltransferase [Lachnospiraceae bacterium]
MKIENKVEKIGEVLLDYSNYPGEDFYSEGAEEDALLETVKSHSKKEYNRLIAENSRWSMLYHLSHIRGNIVDFLPITKHDRVLEVGSGCGAITGTLAEKAHKVTCIELSKKRSLINAYRNKDKDNVEIKVGNFQDVEIHLTEKYDYIMLIGVFEYAASYIKDDSPYEKFLEILSSHLTNGGQIVIAIENKYGMKYWAGCKEDHVGKFFEGIEGYTKTEGVKTFSKNSLEKLVKRCGFSSEFFYPYPDYKLPITIYSDQYLPKVGELNDNIRNFDAERVIAFDEGLAFDEMIREDMFPFYSNSYLAILNRDEKVESFTTRKPIYSKHSNERDDRFCIRTDIEKNGYGEMFVSKTPHSPIAKEHVAKLANHYDKQIEQYEGTKLKPNKGILKEDRDSNQIMMQLEYLTGKTLEQKLDELYDQGKIDELINQIDEFCSTIRGMNKKVPFTMTEPYQTIFGNVALPGEQESLQITNLDLIFSNIIINQGWNVIDYEWTFEFPIPINFVIYRALFYYFFHDKQEFAIKNKIYERFGISKEEVVLYKQMEHHFQQYIIGDKFSLVSMYSLMGRNAVSIARLAEYGALLPRCDRVKVYFDKGDGFNENNTCFYTATFTDEERVTLEFVTEADVKAVRIDPASYPCMVMLHNFGVECVLVNGTVMPGNTVFYHTDDPQIIIEKINGGQKIHIEYTITMFRKDFFENIAEGITHMQNSIFKKRKGPYEKVRLS